MLGDYTEPGQENWPRMNVLGAYLLESRKMEMHCPHCQSTDIRKVSLVYQEGRFDAKARTRLRGFLLGTDGPDLVVGGANSTGVLQSQLSRNLRPPVKWSYLKLAGWFALSSFVALMAYVHSVMSTAATASSLPVSIYVVVASCLLLFLRFLFWRHNHLVYPRQFAAWERSFLCMRCGSVSAHLGERAVS